MKHILAILSFIFIFNGVCAQSQISKIEQNDSIDINPALLDEVVVIGYGEEHRRDLTGSTSSIQFKKNDLYKPSTSIESELTGKLAGVRVVTNSGSLDAQSTITVRGGTSITQDNSPLIIVDGFPVQNLDDIPLTSIQSIDVLKDAAATAIFGAQGGNGVIIITTYKGGRNKMDISYNSNYGVRKLAKELNVLSPYEYAKLQYEIAYQNSENLENYTNLLGEPRDWDIYRNITPTDWQEKVFGRTAFFTSQNINISYNSKKTTYHADYTYNLNNGIMLGSQLQTHNVGLSTQTSLSNRLKLNTNTRFSYKEATGAGTAIEGSTTSSRLKNTLLYAPLNAFAYENTDNYTDYENNASLANPVTLTNDDYKKALSHSFRFDIGLQAYLDKRKKLSWNTNVGGWIGNKKNNRAYGLSTSQSRTYGNQPLAYHYNERENKFRENSSLTFNAFKDQKDHSLKFMVGEELIAYNNQYENTEGLYFPKSIDLCETFNNFELAKTVNSYEHIYPSDRTFSFFGRTTYDYKHTYMASFSLRADRSSKFALKNQWGYFPAAALAWRLSEEQFFENQPLSITDAKIRISFGSSGNNKVKNGLYNFSYHYGDSNDNSIYFNEIPVSHLTTSSILNNPDLKWETNIKRNIGFDLSLVRNRIELSFDAYYNTTNDLLISRSIATESGYKSMMDNLGETSNRGFEFGIKSTLFKNNDWEISLNTNISINRNRIENLGGNNQTLVSSGWAGAEISSDFILQEGKPTGQIYGYLTNGYYTVNDFNYDSKSQKYTLKEGVVSDKEILSLGNSFGPGSLRIKDLNGDGEITEADRTIIGDVNPDATGGLSINVKFKNFDFGIDSYWSLGNDVYNANKIESTTSNKYLYRNMTSEMSDDNRWTNIDDCGNYITDPELLAKMNANKTIWSPIIGRYVLHSWAVEDGSFFKISKITLGYNLPSTLLQKLHLTSLRIYGCIDNVYCFTKYTGFDPEVNSRNSTPLTPGVDYSTYPRSRAYSIGMNLTF